jgi:predicted acetyltransferase
MPSSLIAPHLATPALKYADPDAPDEFFAAILRGFHEDYVGDLWDKAKAVFEPERNFGFRVGERWVSTCGAYSRVMTVPGGTVPTAAVTVVTVHPTYRRRGLLTAMMQHQLEDIHQRGVEPVALLWASESLIYGRFGYGHATPRLRLSGQTRSTAYLPGVDVGAGSVGEIERNEAIPVIKSLHAKLLADRPGSLDRSEAWWANSLYDPEPWRNGATAMRYALHYNAVGKPDGYLNFRTKGGGDSTGPASEVEILHNDAADPGAYAALHRFALDLDLVRTFAKRSASVHDPLRYLVADPRAIKTELTDGTYVRLVDVRRALEARTYPAELDVVIGVSDPLLPQNDGAIRVEAGPGGAKISKARRKPDLSLDVRELGAIYLGGVSLNALRHAGLVQERTRGAVSATAAAFSWPRAPFCPDFF